MPTVTDNSGMADDAQEPSNDGDNKKKREYKRPPSPSDSSSEEDEATTKSPTQKKQDATDVRVDNESGTGSPAASNLGPTNGAATSLDNFSFHTQELDITKSEEYERNNCSKFIVDVNLAMLPFLLPLTLNSERNRIVLTVLDVNHNRLQPKVLMEIINQIIENAYGLEKSTHSKSMGRDIRIKAMYWNRSLVTDNSDPSVHRLRTLFAEAGQQDNDEMATYYPPASADFDKEWAKHWYEQEGGKDYCLLDPTTKDGRKEVARYNNLLDDWIKVAGKDESNFDKKKTPICERLYALALLYAKKGNSKHVYFSAMEGMHRVTATILFLFGGTVDDTGIISPGTLAFRDFTEHLESKNLPTENLQNVIERFLNEPQCSDMLKDAINAQVSYLNNTESSAEAFCKHARILSKAVSENKKDSVSVGPFHKIGQFVSDSIRLSKDDSHIYRPNFNFSRFKVPQTPIHGLKKAKAVYAEADKDEMRAYPYCELLDSTVMKKYINDPFGKGANQDIRSLLSAKPKEDSLGIKENDNSVTLPEWLFPPFGVPLKSITEDYGSKKKEEAIMTTEIANQYYFIPPIMHILYASTKNVKEKEVARNEELTTMITFYLKHIADSKDDVTSVETHRAYEVIYNKPYTSTIIQRPLHILGAAQFIVGMINAVLAYACDNPKDSLNDRQIAVRKAAINFTSAMNSVQTKMLGAATDDALFVLAVLNMDLWEWAEQITEYTHHDYIQSQSGYLLKPFYKSLIRRNALYDTLCILHHHGLSPRPRDDINNVAPEVQAAYEFIVKRNQDKSGEYDKNCERMMKDGTNFFSGRFKDHHKNIHKTSGDPTKSVLHFFILSAMHQFIINYATTKQPMFEGGTPAPSLEKNRDFPRANICLKPDGSDEPIQVTQLKDLGLKDTADQILSLKAQALIAFQTKSSSHGDCSPELMSAVNSFREKGEKLFSIDHDGPAFQKPERAKKQSGQTKKSSRKKAAPVAASEQNNGRKKRAKRNADRKVPNYNEESGDDVAENNVVEDGPVTDATSAGGEMKKKPTKQQKLKNVSEGLEKVLDLVGKAIRSAHSLDDAKQKSRIMEPLEKSLKVISDAWSDAQDLVSNTKTQPMNPATMKNHAWNALLEIIDASRPLKTKDEIVGRVNLFCKCRDGFSLTNIDKNAVAAALCLSKNGVERLPIGANWERVVGFNCTFTDEVHKALHSSDETKNSDDLDDTIKAVVDSIASVQGWTCSLDILERAPKKNVIVFIEDSLWKEIKNACNESNSLLRGYKFNTADSESTKKQQGDDAGGSSTKSNKGEKRKSKASTDKKSPEKKRKGSSNGEDEGDGRTKYCLPIDFKEEVHLKPPDYKHVNANRYDPNNRPKRRPQSGDSCDCRTSIEEREKTCDHRCLNRIGYVECNENNCKNGPHCGNRAITKRQFAQCKPMKEPGKGWGLVTTNGVKVGDLVEEYAGEVVNERTKEERLMEWSRDHPHDPNFYLMHLQPGWYIDARVMGNMARFINHSCDPNCKAVPVNVNGHMRIAIVCIKDVPPGGFLGFDYRFDTLDGDKFICCCSAPNCRGTLKGGKGGINGTNEKTNERKTKRQLLSDAQTQIQRHRKFLKEIAESEKGRLNLTGPFVPGTDTEYAEMVAGGPKERYRHEVRERRIFLWRNARMGGDFRSRCWRNDIRKKGERRSRSTLLQQRRQLGIVDVISVLRNSQKRTKSLANSPDTCQSGEKKKKEGR